MKNDLAAAGIDLGGTKIEAQVFDSAWDVVARQRLETPKTYDALVTEIAKLAQWVGTTAGAVLPIGIGAAGLVHPDTGLALTANLAASGKPFPRDIAQAVGREVTYVNDCRALALSEAVFGAGRGHRRVAALIIGTGIGGGVVMDQTIMKGPTMTGGEFGHCAAPAHVIAAHALPLRACGCGRRGCIETYLAGPGLERLAQDLTGHSLAVPEIAAQRRGDMAQVWAVWCAIAGELLHQLTLMLDPDVIVLGGGLSKIAGVTDDLNAAAEQAQFGGFGTAPVVLAQGARPAAQEVRPMRLGRIRGRVMSEGWIAPDRLFDGQTVRSGIGLQLDAGQVAEIGPAPEGAQQVRGLVSPGFVDLQVNGGGGVMLNADPSVEGMQQIAQAHRSFGTVAVMPTVITDAPEVMAKAADAAIAAKGEDGVLGLHIEGPHIASARRGTHAAEFIRPCDAGTLAVVQRLRDKEVPVMITVAPEAITPEQITALTQMGAVVAIGHTDASAEQVEIAIAAGASSATHLFNAMSPMTTRAPGAVGAVMDASIAAGIICDGHHVDDRMIRLALRGRPDVEGLFLVSDAMATVGGPEAFALYGQTIALRDGRLVNAEGNLAGAHMTQFWGVQRLVGSVGADLQRALRMAVSIPARVMGQAKLGQLVGRKARDVIVLSEGLECVGSLDAVATGA